MTAAHEVMEAMAPTPAARIDEPLEPEQLEGLEDDATATDADYVATQLGTQDPTDEDVELLFNKLNGENDDNAAKNIIRESLAEARRAYSRPAGTLRSGPY